MDLRVLLLSESDRLNRNLKNKEDDPITAPLQEDARNSRRIITAGYSFSTISVTITADVQPSTGSILQGL